MPKIGKSLLKSSFFLFRLDPKSGEVVGPEGTGSFVGKRWADGKHIHVYAVTNKHVAVTGGASIIRVNTTDGKTRPLDYAPEDWVFSAKGDDLAIIDVSDDMRNGLDDFSVTMDDAIVHEEDIANLEIGPGEDVFMIGLYPSHSGDEINIPSGRFGNLSMMASDKAPVFIEETERHRPAFLADMRSRSGFSGSPVYVYRTPATDLTGIKADGRWNLSTSKNLFLGLLGVHCQQFWDRLTFRKATHRSESAAIKDGDEIEVHGAMTVIVPATRIIEMLEMKEFEEARKKREQNGPVSRFISKPEITVSVTDTPVDEANPNHKEDFTALLDAAARKQK